TYVLDATLELGAADAGSTYRACEGEHVVVSGGRAITGWAAIGGGAYRAPTAGLPPFSQLFVDDVPRYRARTPQAGYLHNVGPVTFASPSSAPCPPPYTDLTPPNGSPLYACTDRFVYAGSDLDPAWSGLAVPSHPIEIVDFEDWTVARERLVGLNPTT